MSPSPRSRRGSVRSTRTSHGTTTCIARGARPAAPTSVVFPELGLTGYQLQDLAARSPCGSTTRAWPSWPPRPAGLSAVVSFVEESADHRLFIAAALLEDGELRARPPQAVPADLRAVRRASVLRRRRPAARGPVAARRRARDRRSARTSGTSRCPQILALDGAQMLINISSSPGRDLAATNEVGLGTATSWRTLMRTYAQLDHVVRGVLQPRRRRRVDLVLGRLRGHRAERRGGLLGAAVRRGAVHRRHRAGRHPARADRAAAAARRAARAPGARAAPDRGRTGRPGARHDRRPGRRGGARRRRRRAAPTRSASDRAARARRRAAADR